MVTNSVSESNFQQEYSHLNTEQKLAVDTIDGPVMVIAGAGTGKTQTIALRIGKILKDTQTNSHNILCLTFTESAAINMRTRLVSLIGPTGYSVRVGTFHAFCNGVIRDNPQYFLFSKREAVPLDDVKQIQIVRQCIDKLLITSPLKNINFTYFFQKDIIRALQTLKKENITPDLLQNLNKKAADFVNQATPYVDQLSAIRATPKAAAEINTIINSLATLPVDILYQSRIKLFQSLDLSPSELKKEVRDFVISTSNNLTKNTDLLAVYRGYQQALKDQNLYDYDDMILWVINAFKTNPDLLAQYQETYQYILVDEFQDTNSSQYQIVSLLLQNQEKPNIFVVGDDDQSIYRFQGASVENIFTFYQTFKSNLKVIVLKNNYRSHQLILESSNQIISNNLNRITKYIDNIDKSLTAVATFDPNPINLFTAKTNLEENYYVAKKIKDLIESGVKPPEIAVLYRNNTDIADLLPFLSQNQIKYLLSDSIDILQTIEIQQLIDLFRYIFHPDDANLYAKILSFNFINIKSLALYKIFHHQIDPLKIKKINKFQNNLAFIQKQLSNDPPDAVFNEIIRRFGFLKYILKTGRIDLLKQLNALYSHLKSALQIEKISLSQWVDNLTVLIEDGLTLNSPPLQSVLANSIRLMTVHKAKGLEFEHVFLIKVLSGKWDNSSVRNLIKLPLGILATDISQILTDTDLEEDRRLFYVALTRAKRQIYLSYSQFNDAHKEQLHSVFINEINPKLIENINSSPELETQSLLAQFSPVLPKLNSPDLKAYLTHYLTTQYRFNVTHLNSYLHCPFCFFFKTIMHLPQAKTKSLSFGTSVHGALAYLFQTHCSVDKFLEIFRKNLRRENLSSSDFSDLLESGKKMLSDYYSHYQSEFDQVCLIEHDFKTYNVRLNNIPLTGKIDKMEMLPGGYVNVVDYKTGKPDSKYKELSSDGDYFRQLVFYKILCHNAKGFKYQVKSGTIDFVKPNHTGTYVRKTFDITPEAVALLSTQITEVFGKIQNLEFPIEELCDDPDHLHYLFAKYFK